MTPDLSLNGFRVELSSPTFTAYVRDELNNTGLRALREELGDAWFLYWRGGKIFGLPRVANLKPAFGEPVELAFEEHPQLLAARIEDALPEKFPKYKAFRRRPFSFLGRKDEIVNLVAAKLGGFPDVLDRFKIRPRFDLEAKLVELREGETFVGVFVNVRTRWEIQGSLSDLREKGIDLRGLYAVRRNPNPGERRLVGKIKEVSERTVTFSESFDDTSSLSTDEVWIEGSRTSFAHCLKQLLGDRYREFDEERQRQEARFTTGPAVDKLLEKMGRYLRDASPIELSPGLDCSVVDRIDLENSRGYKTVVSATPVEYCFDPARTKRSSYPWYGIERYGPFSRDTFPKKSPNILVLFPDTVQGPVEGFLRAFRDGVTSQSGPSRYSAGFGGAFGLTNPRFTLRKIPWLGGYDQEDIAEAYRTAAEEYLAETDSPPDAAIVVILDEHARLPDHVNPYLRSKSVLLMGGVPVQDIRLSTMQKPPNTLQYTLQNIAVALYAKMNGTPWTVDSDPTIADELVIGMGTAELSGSRFSERQRFVGITTVFRGDGNYLLGNLSRECRYDEYPRLLKSSTTSILREIKERNGWRPDDTVRLVFHAHKPLKNVEVADIVAECVREVGNEQIVEFAFLTISHDHPFTIIDTSQKGVGKGDRPRKGVYVPDRGTIAQLGKYTRLLCANSPSMIKRPKSPLPKPLLLHLHPESTYKDLTYLSEQALKFTSLSWRSTLPAREPVTIHYSEQIAKLLARLRSVPDWSPATLNAKLRASRWFL